jgi:hypothetical protein
MSKNLIDFIYPNPIPHHPKKPNPKHTHTTLKILNQPCSNVLYDVPNVLQSKGHCPTLESKILISTPIKERANKINKLH